MVQMRLSCWYFFPGLHCWHPVYPFAVERMSQHLVWMTRKTLRKPAYSNILKIVPPKNEIFQIKNSDIFLISAQNIDCGYIFHISAQNIDCGYSLEPPQQGESNEYLQSMF